MPRSRSTQEAPAGSVVMNQSSTEESERQSRLAWGHRHIGHHLSPESLVYQTRPSYKSSNSMSPLLWRAKTHV